MQISLIRIIDGMFRRHVCKRIPADMGEALKALGKELWSQQM